MEHKYRQIAVDWQGDVLCVRLLRCRLDEEAVEQLGQDLAALARDPRCRKVALSLGPEPIDCRYSMFLAILIALRRQVQERGGALKLCQVGPEVLSVFEACHLKDHFEFAPDTQAAMAALSPNV